MKGNVNPFEPWRPTEVNVPPPLHASRPWRPPASARKSRSANATPLADEPPFVEPVNPTRNKPPQRLPQQERLRGRASGPPLRPAPARRSLMGPLVAMGGFFLLVVLCIAGLDWMRGTHLPRLVALGISAGLLVGVALTRRRRWPMRLAWMAVALALAGLTAWFVPTTHGVSLWSAYQQVEELRALPPGDLAGYQRGTSVRKAVIAEFPTFAPDVAAAEQSWLRRTADHLIEQTDRQLANDPQKALVDLHHSRAELERLDQYPLVKKDLEAAHRRAVQACLKVAQK